SYTVRHLGGDYPIATVSETSQYNLKTCTTGNAAPTGYTYRLTLDKLEMVEIGCDGGFAPTPEVYYSFSVTNDAGTKTVVSLPSTSPVDIGEGGFHTFPHNQNDYSIYKDGRGTIKINGTAWDQDGGSNDDRIGVWTNLTYGASTSNGQRFFTREENGCKVRLYLTMTRLGNLYD
ncbi:MAG: hypothetical protein HKN12_06060, partial [Gemmatimonadetes bacterium]|nr:hypothetical protein [Gemmatimonadota bacterium]